jgi:hypothetical protein
MSLELISQTTFVSRKYSRQFLEKALELAKLYGWQPLGTRPPLEQDFRLLNTDWLGTYLTNDGQTVSTDDAILLAHALERALDDIPNDRPKMEWNPKFWLTDDLPEWLSPLERDMIEDGLEYCSYDVMETHPFLFFAGEEKQHLIALIRFCRLGSFSIF